MSDHLAPVLDRIDATLPRALDRLMEFLRIPSISTDPVHAADCRAAAEWLNAEINDIGIAATVRDTPGHPMVVGHAEGSGVHLMFYGHYDVQPVDPVDLWDTPPFEPGVKDTGEGRVILGRGSSDDKGQLMTFLEACRAWREEHGKLPAKISVFFEGEEESGSPSLVPFIEEHADELGEADLVLICDTGLFDPETPAIATRLRGLLGEELTITGPSRDLHSGSYGGAAINPIRILSKIIASLHDDRGRVTVPGFYDDIPEIPAALRAQWDALDFDAKAFLGEVGLSEPAGERDRAPLEMLWSRPTCEVNGIGGGYQGDGFKTVLPSKATAKISFRLVEGQDPLKIRESFRGMARRMLPPDCSIEWTDHGAGPAAVMETSHPAFEFARQALSEEWPRDAAFIGMGESIPIAGYFKSILGLDSMLIGFARDDDSIHSPNEKYGVMNFHKGIRSWARLLAKLDAS